MTTVATNIVESCIVSSARSSHFIGAKAILILLIGIRETERPTEFRRLFRIQIEKALLNARRLQLIDGTIAEEARRAVTEGSR